MDDVMIFIFVFATENRFLVVSHFTEYDPMYLALNLCVLALVLLPKMPQFYRVRLNSSAALDESDDASHPHSS